MSLSKTDSGIRRDSSNAEGQWSGMNRAKGRWKQNKKGCFLMSVAPLSQSTKPTSHATSDESNHRYLKNQAKRRARVEQKASKRLSVPLGSQPVTNLPPVIALKQAGECWFAHGGGECASGDFPAQALNRLEMRLGITVSDPVAKRANQRLEHSILCPTCNIIDFTPKADLDGERRYIVDFTSTVDLLRSDVERLFPSLVRRSQEQDDSRSEPGLAALLRKKGQNQDDDYQRCEIDH